MPHAAAPTDGRTRSSAIMPSLKPRSTSPSCASGGTRHDSRRIRPSGCAAARTCGPAKARPGASAGTRNAATFSAIIIASDASCGGCDLNQSGTPDSDAINARKADIQAFFNAGGGLLYLAGAGNGSSSTGVYYQSVPVPAGGQPVSAPFTVTSDGAALGITSTMANCCATHNSFTLPPAGSALKVAETDSAGLAESLFATGASIGATGFTTSPTTTSGPGTPQNMTFPPKDYFTKPQQGVQGTSSSGGFGQSFNNPNVDENPNNGDIITKFIGPPGDYNETITFPAPPNQPGGESPTNGVTASAARRHVYGAASAHTTQTGPVSLTVHPTGAARAALRSHRKLRVSVHLAFRSSAKLGTTASHKDFKIKVRGKKH